MPRTRGVEEAATRSLLISMGAKRGKPGLNPGIPGSIIHCTARYVHVRARWPAAGTGRHGPNGAKDHATWMESPQPAAAPAPPDRPVHGRQGRAETNRLADS